MQRTVRLQPNPFHQATLLQLEGPPIQQRRCRIYDLQGNLVEQYSFTGNQLEIKRTTLVSGVYFFELQEGLRFLGRGRMVVR